jgi:phosphoribosylamine-glycine ligase
MTPDPATRNLVVLVIGKGGREHALAWKLSESPSVKHVFVHPGNAGTAEGNEYVSNLAGVSDPNSYRCIADRAKDLGVGLVVVGPDDAVVNGIESFFRIGLSTIKHCDSC